MTQAVGRGDAIAAGGLLVVTLLFGGGSRLFPTYRLVVELAAVLALAWFAWRSWQRPQGWPTWVAVALLTSTILMLLVQLIPLPSPVWQALPGREDAAAVYAAADASDRAAPLSLNPAGTRSSIAFFIVPFAMFVVALRSGADVRRLLLQLIAGFAILNGLLVVLQFQGFPWLTFYYTTSTRPGSGLFANKNHSAVFLVAAMPALAWTIKERWHSAPLATRRWIAAAATGFISLTVFGCLSRAGLALLPIGLLASGMILTSGRPTRRGMALTFGGLAAAAVLLVIVLPQTAVVGRALERFDAGSDLRYQFWPVVVDTTKAYLPFGSGFGTFPEVFAAREPLSIVRPTYVNHAHSDYMEIALEGGVPAIVILAGFLIWFCAVAALRLRACRWGSVGFAPVVIAVAGVLELILHSLLDYPLRTLALAGLAAMYCAVLAAPPSALDLEPPRRYRQKVRRTAR